MEINKRDMATIERLVGKYGEPAVVRAAKAKPPVKRGRRPDPILNALNVWAHVELRRARPGKLKPHSIEKACQILANDWKTHTVGRPLIAKSFRNFYNKGAKLRADSEMKKRSDEVLQFLVSEVRKTIPGLLHKNRDGSYENTIIDRRAGPVVVNLMIHSD